MNRVGSPHPARPCSADFSDMIISSPTTTFEDYTAVQDLLELAQVSDMRGLGETMLSGGASLAKVKPRKMLEADFKRYSTASPRIGQ